MYDHQGKIKEPNIAAEVGQGLFGMAKSYAQKDMGGVFKGAMGLFKTATGNTQKAEEYSRRTRTSAADAVSHFRPFLWWIRISDEYWYDHRSPGVDARMRRQAQIPLRQDRRRVP